MKTKAEFASEDIFHNGFNCSQSVLGVFADDYDLEQETAFKMTCGLGGGCRRGEICGTVSAGVLVVGLKHGNGSAEETAEKETCNIKTAEFVDTFKAENGAIVCRELLGVDISDEEAFAAAQEQGGFEEQCRGYVKSAVEILERLGY